VSQHAADDFAYIAKRNKEIAEERTALVGASVSYRVADYLTDQSAVWISAWEDDGGW
jgi:lipase chaperone LimK